MSLGSVLWWLLVYVGPVSGVVALATFVGRKWAEKWLQNKFDSALEKLQQANRKELENVRLETNKLLDRATKLSQREFEVLPEAWQRLNTSLTAVNRLVNSVKMRPNLDVLPADEIHERLNSTPLSRSERQRVVNAENKSDEFEKLIGQYEHAAAASEFESFQSYLNTYGIFIRQPLLSSFQRQAEFQVAALIENKLRAQTANQSFNRAQALTDEGIPQRDSLEKEIHAYLTDQKLSVIEPKTPPVKAAPGVMSAKNPD
jgi:hypothetical protein